MSLRQSSWLIQFVFVAICRSWLERTGVAIVTLPDIDPGMVAPASTAALAVEATATPAVKIAARSQPPRGRASRCPVLLIEFFNTDGSF